MEYKMMQVFATLTVFLALSFQPVFSQVDISKAGCGTTKLCVQQPADCDPADNTTACLFGSATPSKLNPPNGVDLAFELSGNSSGYIAVGLTQNLAQPIMLFVCGKNSSGSFFSMSTIYFNDTYNSTLAKAMTNVKNTVDGENIKCTFTVAGLNATTDAGLLRGADTSYIMVIGSGSVDGNGLGTFNIGNFSGLIDLSSFQNSTITPTTPSAASPLFYSNAMLLLVSFLALSILRLA